jgi:predicted nucleotidyltransferase
MQTLREILRKKEARKTDLLVALESIVRQLGNMGALKVIHFGSVARGHVDVHSDLDLLAVMPSTKSGKEWMKLVYEGVERGIASDIIVYNQDEFDQRLPSSSFLRNVLRSGRVVYEKTA